MIGQTKFEYSNSYTESADRMDIANLRFVTSIHTSGDPFNEPVYLYILRANSTMYLTNLYKIDDSTYVGIYT